MSKHKPIDVELMKSLFEYKNGQLIWNIKTSPKSRAEVGKVAGTLDKQGYRRVAVCGKLFKASRIIFAIHHGDPKELEIDHINQMRSDNRIENLRAVTRQENLRNQRKRSCNSSGITGVYWHKPAQKWQVLISVNRKEIYCGLFNHRRAAAVERKYQEIKHGFHENHGS